MRKRSIRVWLTAVVLICIPILIGVVFYEDSLFSPPEHRKPHREHSPDGPFAEQENLKPLSQPSSDTSGFSDTQGPDSPDTDHPGNAQGRRRSFQFDAPCLRYGHLFSYKDIVLMAYNFVVGNGYLRCDESTWLNEFRKMFENSQITDDADFVGRDGSFVVDGKKVFGRPVTPSELGTCG